MNLQVISDVHFEFTNDYGKSFVEELSNENVDILVLAGDTIPIGNPHAHQAFQYVCDKFPTVIAVLGNHEYYGSHPSVVLTKMHTIENSISNLHWLRIDNPFVKDSKRIIGDTLWFADNGENERYTQGMMDFHTIRDFTPWVYEQNTAQVEWLWDNCKSTDIVVTHHLPTFHCVNPRYHRHAMNRFFVCELDELMLEKKPKIWICGHTHLYYRGEIYYTDVIVNPLGYPREFTNCNRRLIIDF